MDFAIGIDPSQRHTGVCVVRRNNPTVIAESYDIETGKLSILDSGLLIRGELRRLFSRYPNATYAVEKSMPGARCGALLFYVQMILLEELSAGTDRKLVHILPVQLKSFMKSKVGVVPSNKTEIVRYARELSKFKGRMSSHIADAYFLALAAGDVRDGLYSYNISRGELPIISWRVLGGRYSDT